MSSSEEDSKIDLIDSAAQLKKKLKRAFCEPGNIKDNGLLSFCKHVLFQLPAVKDGFAVSRKEENGGNVVYKNYDELESAFAKEELHPGDFKTAVEFYINELLEPIRKEFETPEMKALTKAAYSPAQKAPAKEDEVTPSRLDFKVGRILSVEKHPDADSLYIEKVDLGEDNPRTVVSGLAGLIPMEELNNKLGVFLCNLKSQKMRGIESQAMLMCASQNEPRQVEMLDPPEGSAEGEVIFIEGHNGTPDKELKPKKKIWEKLQPEFLVNTSGIAEWNGYQMRSKLGLVKSSSLRNVPIK